MLIRLVYPFITYTFILFSFFSCSSDIRRIQPENSFVQVELLVPENHIEIDHKYFKVSYDTAYRLPKYVIYKLHAEKLKMKQVKRKDRFRADPILKERNLPFVIPKEYSKSGFDKGHLAPSADFAWSSEANDATFLMTNMVPQSPSLNRDAWKKLEEKVRLWACGEEIITVITGPILKAGLPRLKSGLSVPKSFYKIIIDETPPRKAVSFIFHQKDKGDVILKRLVSLGEVENLTNLSFSSYLKGTKVSTKRAPASLDDWREVDCVGKQ